jgi:site-specific DNA-methyltransferase (adenine-specific)
MIDDIKILQGDCTELLTTIEAGTVDLVFADPPYFLSGGGTTCRAGKRASVDKGGWDVPTTPDEMHEFNRRWIKLCLGVLRPTGSIWICGTYHNIGSCLFACQQLGAKILNLVTWKKSAPPPNLGCRTLTHSCEQLIWAARGDAPHKFDYRAMRVGPGAGRQLKDLWEFGRPRADEITHGRHQTQKPEALVKRVLMACTAPGDLVLDPFAGSGTTPAVARQTGRRCIAIDTDPAWADVTRARVAGERLQGDLFENRTGQPART